MSACDIRQPQQHCSENKKSSCMTSISLLLKGCVQIAQLVRATVTGLLILPAQKIRFLQELLYIRFLSDSASNALSQATFSVFVGLKTLRIPHTSIWIKAPSIDGNYRRKLVYSDGK
jgi:hypothetical protein